MANESATAQDGDFMLISLLPDVCLTPSKPVGVPVPYMITHTMDKSKQCSRMSFFGKKPPTCTMKASWTTSQGTSLAREWAWCLEPTSKSATAF